MAAGRIFHENSYKTALKTSLLEKKDAFGNQFTFQAMAKACRIQKTYLSKVLADEKAHLSADQVFLAATYLGLNDEERRFLLLLHERERSVIPARRRQIDRDVDSYRKKHSKTERVIPEQDLILDGDDLRDYYLEPYAQLTHLFLTIEKYRENPETIRACLGLPKDRFTRILNDLIRMGLVETGGGSYRVLKKKMHLSADSPLVGPHRQILRMRALDQIQRSPQAAYSFSVVFSTDAKVRARIQERFFAFLKEIEAQVKDSEPSEVYQMNFDLLNWSQA